MTRTGRASARIASVLQVVTLVLASAAAGASRAWIEVAADGSGDFRTIQAAIDHVPARAASWTIIHVAAGRYFEKVTIPSDKAHVVLVGDGRDATLLEFDQSYLDSSGTLLAKRVLTNRGSDVVLRSLTIRNLAKEPGGSGGKWDAAVENYGDRLILNDVLLRADHDTLLLYGPAFCAGPGPSRVHVHDSHIQGRGDFIASFSSTFIEASVLETIRDRSHFLFQAGASGLAPSDQAALIVRKSVFTGQSSDPIWPAGVSNLAAGARVYLLWNVFEFDIGANRPMVHFHDALEPFTSSVRYFGNSQSRSTLSPLIRDTYSIPGPSGTPRIDLPVSDNEFGEPISARLARTEAEAITPLWLFGDWDPRTAEPRSDCEDGVDNDGDGLTDLAGGDPGCASQSDFAEVARELPCDNGLDDDGDGRIDLRDPGCSGALDPSETGEANPSCGLGPELALVLPLLCQLKRRGGGRPRDRAPEAPARW